MKSEKEISEKLQKLRKEVQEEFIITQEVVDNLERLTLLNEVTAKNSKALALSWVLEISEKL